MNKKDIQALTKEFKRCYKNHIIIELILEIMYPNKCVLCGKASAVAICDSCKASNPIIKEPRCMCCGKQIEAYEKEYCNDCIEGKKHFTQGRSIWVHKGVIKQSIYRFKYKNHRINAKEYARLLIQEHLDTLGNWKPEVMIPVPIHKHRRRSRGYNQAEVLALAIQEHIKKEADVEIPIISSIRRARQTTYQKKLNTRQRKRNLSQAFIMKEGTKLPSRVLIIDDIYTTGATLNEISNLVKKAGAEQVFFLTISIGQGF